MKPLNHDAIITDASSGPNYSDPRGQIYVTVGTGGHSLKTYNATTAMSAAQYDLRYDPDPFGYLRVKIMNSSKTLTSEFFGNGSQNPLDTFTINHNDRFSYHPFFTYWGNSSSYTQINDDPSLRLSTFTLATWFQTNEDYGNSTLYPKKSIIANKGGFGSEVADKNMNYGIWIDIGSTEGGKIQAGFEMSNGMDKFVKT
jgi:hypothetical protein